MWKKSSRIPQSGYAVAAGAGSLHPRWTYYFDGGQYAWLTTILALNPAP